MAESGWFRTEGGSVILMDLPLPDVIQQRVDAGLITRVNPDGTPWTGDDPVPAPTPAPAPVPDPAPAPEKPHHSAHKAAWVDYAVEVGGMSRDEASDLTKAELIERFG
jgi:hypothetical protein